MNVAQDALVEDVYERVKAAVGTQHVRHLGRVAEREFQRYAYAVGEVNPVYLSDEAARASGRPGVVAPPLYLTSILSWESGPAASDLRHDGAGRSELAGVDLEGLRLMGAGQDVELHHEVVDGDEVTLTVSVEHIELKRGESGALVLVRLLREYASSDGRRLVTCRETFIGR